MTERIAVGTPVTVNNGPYGGLAPSNDLVVLSHDCNPRGYGIGPKGNDPTMAHHVRSGWLYYPADRVTPKEESKAVTKFNIGDKVRVKSDGYTDKAWIGVEGIVRGKGLYANQYRVELTDPKTTGRAVGYMANLGGKLELIEGKPLTLNGFTVGDKVRFTGNLWKNLEGTVSAINYHFVDVLVTKMQDNPGKYSSIVVGKTLTEACGGLGIDTRSLEKIEKPAPLKEGDRVVVDLDRPHSSWHKAEGVLVSQRTPNTWRVRIVKVGQSGKVHYAVGELHPLTNLTLLPPFTFKDIRKGDTIRRTKTYKSGAREVREGVAAVKGSYFWSDEDDNFILAYGFDDANSAVTLELLSRSEPEPVKEVWEDAKVLTRQIKGENADTFVKNDDGSWTIYYPSGGTFKIAASEKLTEYLEDSEVKVLVKA